MKVIASLELPPRAVAMAGCSDAQIRELITDRDGAPTFAMRMFDVAPGGYTPLHEHPWEHEAYVLAGPGERRGGESPRPLRSGDAIFVAPNERHQFANTGAETLRFLCLVPNDQPCCR